jgi:hypothetical protein
VLAERLETETTVDNDKIVKAFRTILCRKPTATELNILTQYYHDELAEFNKNQTAARKTLNVGEYPHPAKQDTVTTAALMRVIDTLYNLEETITRT